MLKDLGLLAFTVLALGSVGLAINSPQFKSSLRADYAHDAEMYWKDFQTTPRANQANDVQTLTREHEILVQVDYKLRMAQRARIPITDSDLHSFTLAEFAETNRQVSVELGTALAEELLRVEETSGQPASVASKRKATRIKEQIQNLFDETGIGFSDIGMTPDRANAF